MLLILTLYGTTMSEILGGFEHQVLLAMMRLNRETYSVPIVRELEKATGRSVAPAAVYMTLRRLQERGLLTTRMAPPPKGQGGRERRLFRVTAEAVALLKSTRASLDRLWDGIEALEV
jgi:DNA-binding PadR family transcriptional regulator